MTKGTGAVLIGGIATQAVAILCWYGIFQLFHFDVLKFWVNLILPFGALTLGLFGACGFWLAGRAMNRPATPRLKLAAVAVAVAAVFVIRYLGYWMLEFEGVPVHSFIGFGTYLSETLGHARMDFSHGAHSLGSVDLGALGYLMEALQTAAYAVSSYAVVARLPRAVRCKACYRWMEEAQSGTILCDDQTRFRALHEALPADGANRLAALRATPSDGGDAQSGTIRLSWRLAECPDCSGAALVEAGALHNGQYFAPVAVLARSTPFLRGRPMPPPAPEMPTAAPIRSFGRRTVP